jgi:hypothetical protein
LYVKTLKNTGEFDGCSAHYSNQRVSVTTELLSTMTRIISFLLLIPVSHTFVAPGGSFFRPSVELRRTNDEAILWSGSDATASTTSDVFQGILQQEEFLENMDQQKKDIDDLSQQYTALDNVKLAVEEVGSFKSTLGDAAVERLTRLAADSASKYNTDMSLVGFQGQTSKSTKGLTGSSNAFALLGVALAAGALATNSPAVMEQLSTFEIPAGLTFDGLPAGFEFPEMNTEFMAQVGAMKGSLMDQTNLLKDQLSNVNSDEFIEPLRANIATMKESAMEQTTQALAALQASKTTVFSQLYHWWNSAQASTASQINVAKESISTQLPVLEQSLHAQVEGIQATVQDLESSMTLQIQTIQDAVPGYMDTIQTTVAEKTLLAQDMAQDAQATAATKAVVVQEQLVVLVDNMKQGLVAFLAQLRKIVEDAQYTLQTSVATVNEQLPGYVESAKETVAVQTSEMQNAVQNMQGSIQTSIGDLQGQLPGYVESAKETVAVQTSEMQNAVQNMQGSIQTSVGDLQGQLPVYMDAAKEMQSSMEASVANLQADIAKIDVSRFSAIIKEIQAAIGTKVTTLEMPQLVVLPASVASESTEPLAGFNIFQSSADIDAFFRNR